MTETELITLGNDCYAAFNQTAPKQGARSWSLWAEMCKDVPLAAAGYIRGKVIELDSMPRNFGKAVRSYWHEWRAEKGQPYQAQTGCAICDKSTPGFFTVWRVDGNRVLCRCKCNHEQCFDPMPYRTPADMAELGYIVRPTGHRGTFLNFERERFRISHMRQGESHYLRKARELAENPRIDDSVRPSHAEQLILAGA